MIYLIKSAGYGKDNNYIDLLKNWIYRRHKERREI